MTPLETVLQTYTFPPNIKVIHPIQVECINDLASLPQSGSWLEMSCVDSETEYLTPTGWRRIADYESGPVAQFVPTDGGFNGSGRLEFVQPSRHIKEPCTEEMVVIKTNRSVSQKMTKDHRTVHVGYSGKWGESTAGEVLGEHHRLARGYKNRVVTTFDNPGGPGIPFTEAQLRVVVAVVADGHMRSWTKCDIRVKRPRKIERLRRLLKDANIAAKELLEPWEGCDGFVRFSFVAPTAA